VTLLKTDVQTKANLYLLKGSTGAVCINLENMIDEVQVSTKCTVWHFSVKSFCWPETVITQSCKMLVSTYSLWKGTIQTFIIFQN